MELFLRLIAGALIAAILTIVLDGQRKDYALLLSLSVCTMLILAASVYMKPLLDFLWRLTDTGGMDGDFVQLLLKIVGIGFVSRIASMVCADAGNRSLGQALQMVTTFVILWIALPLLEQLLMLMESVLEAI